MEIENRLFRRRRSENSIDAGSLEKITGFELEKGLDVTSLVKRYKNLGFQASQLGRAAELLERMKKEEASIFLSCSANIISSGLREIVAQLVKLKLVKGIVATTAFVEEDVIKTLSPFLLGSFDVDDNEVKANKLNRIGNIFVSDESYIALEKWHNDFLKDFCLKSRTIVPSEYIAEIGKKLSDKRSVLYWAAKNEVPIFCPGFVDGALGDHFFIFNEKRHADEKLIIDAAADLTKFYKLILEPKRIGAVILGGGIAKHHLIGAAILRDGLDYAIYISTGNEYDGSLSGAKPKEAVSWNKLKSSKNSVAIDAEATLVFPLLAHVWIHGS